ncbi:MAG: hypothetical protein KDA44_15895 [Planctomycetales bacterium]|nr:hypothetical protein [Planctomycetales bacterium]
MDAWDILIIGIAAYVAVVSLVRMMASRRNELINQVRRQLHQELGEPHERREKEDRDAA